MSPAPADNEVQRRRNVTRGGASKPLSVCLTSFMVVTVLGAAVLLLPSIAGAASSISLQDKSKLILGIPCQAQSVKISSLTATQRRNPANVGVLESGSCGSLIGITAWVLAPRLNPKTFISGQNARLRSDSGSDPTNFIYGEHWVVDIEGGCPGNKTLQRITFAQFAKRMGGMIWRGGTAAPDEAEFKGWLTPHSC